MGARRPPLRRVGAHAVLPARHRRRRLRLARRLSHGQAGTPPRAHLQHPALCVCGLCGRFRDHLAAAAVLPVPGLHRRLRGVCRGRGVAGGTLSRPRAAREGARLHAGLLVVGRIAGRQRQRPGGTAGRESARHPRRARGLALHVDLRHHPGPAAHRHSASAAGIAGVGAQAKGRTAQAPQHRGALQPGTGPHDDRHDAGFCGQLRHRVWRDSAASTDSGRAQPRPRRGARRVRCRTRASARRRAGRRPARRPRNPVCGRLPATHRTRPWRA